MVYSRPMRESGENIGKNLLVKKLFPASRMSPYRVTTPARSGIPRYCVFPD
jgi:hypothetical protein